MRKPCLILTLALLAASAHGAAPAKAVIRRGEYLVTLMGCADCHTPYKMGAKGPEPDRDLWLSGHPAALQVTPAPAQGQGPWIWHGIGPRTAFAGPWGISYAANLTSDPETGIGGWSETAFITALRTGKHEGKGRPILPPMPWEGFGQATDPDLKAILAYLKSTRPIRNAVPDPVPPGQP
jgi:mono/diheme cytochrome c family protein